MDRFLARLLGVDEDDRYRTLYTFFLVLSFVSWTIELILSRPEEKQEAIGLVADWTGASIGTAIVAIAIVEAIRMVLANSILRKQREALSAAEKAKTEAEKRAEAAEKERDDLRARLQKLENANGNLSQDRQQTD